MTVPASALLSLTLYLGCMIFPWESRTGTQTQHLTTPATDPPTTTVTRGPAACPTPLPLQASTRKP